MKLIFCLLLVASQVSFGQIILKDSSFNKIQLPSYKNNLLQMPGKPFPISPNSGSSVLMSPDNMPCLTPDIAELEKMPNANSKYLQSNDPMPNGVYVAKRFSKNH